MIPTLRRIAGLALAAIPLGSGPAMAQADTEAIPATAVGVLPHDLSPWGMFMTADIVVQAVMVGLALASLATWTVALAKTVELARSKRSAKAAFDIIDQARSLAEATEQAAFLKCGAGALVRAAAVEMRLSSDLSRDGIKERVASRLERIEAAAGRAMGRGTGILATIGSVGPFVGLFGTVWGIMNSFVGISKAQTTNLAVVAPGIAEALLATAIGLVAAIPAVILYNAFARAIGGYKALLGDASAAVLRLVSRDLDRGAGLARAAE